MITQFTEGDYDYVFFDYVLAQAAHKWEHDVGFCGSSVHLRHNQLKST